MSEQAQAAESIVVHKRVVIVGLIIASTTARATHACAARLVPATSDANGIARFNRIPEGKVEVGFASAAHFAEPLVSEQDGSPVAASQADPANPSPFTRHSPSLDNARFYKRGRFFWDKRAATLEAQVLGPIQNSGVWQPGDQRRSCVCCANCHTTVAQVMDSTHNTGLDASRVNIGAGNGVQASSSLDVRLRASDGSPRRLRPTAV